MTSVLSCPAADINNWHISQISPIKQDNSLQLQMVFPAPVCAFQTFMIFTVFLISLCFAAVHFLKKKEKKLWVSRFLKFLPLGPEVLLEN